MSRATLMAKALNIRVLKKRSMLGKDEVEFKFVKQDENGEKLYQQFSNAGQDDPLVTFAHRLLDNGNLEYYIEKAPEGSYLPSLYGHCIPNEAFDTFICQDESKSSQITQTETTVLIPSMIDVLCACGILSMAYALEALKS